MTDWNSSQYLKFEKERTQPAVDLAMRINGNPKTIVDIGCGPGNSTGILKDCFPDAAITGIDSSPNMIAKAKQAHPDLHFRLLDAASLDGKYDLLYSNACLQWIPDHKTLIPYLMSRLNDGGILAVQIPINGEEPLFRMIDEVASDPEFGLAEVELPPNGTLTPAEYYEILCGCSSSFDMWETKYYHTLKNHQALVDWVKGSRLRPYLNHLDDDKGKAFEAEIVERSKQLYPFTECGNVVLGFRRFFFTAVHRDHECTVTLSK